MKNYGLKYFIILLPFLAAFCVELFLLPIDFFTFRPWETLVVQDSYNILEGPFYPNMTLVKTEEGGDLKATSVCAVMKENLVWQTDAYGYRKAASSAHPYPIILIGDSNAAGSGLSQPHLLSEVLEKRLGKSVYPLAPAHVKNIFKHGLLKQHKPEVVILEAIERHILPGHFPIPSHADFQSLSMQEKIIWAIRLNPFVQSAAIKLDRAFKANMIHYIKARINPRQTRATGNAAGSSCPMLFLHGTAANKDIPDSVRHKTAHEIKRLSDFFTHKGIRFIFLPIPNKENIYHQDLGTAKPLFLEKLIVDLRQSGVEVADAQKTFDEITSKTSTPLYHRDDTHWNQAGVQAAARLIEDILRDPPPQKISR